MAKTILILAANPKNTPQLRLDEEIREIDNGLERAQKRSEFTLKQKLASRPVDVRRAMLDYKPNIVHFCGHGSGDEGLAFEDENGQAKLVSNEALAGFFELFADKVECVVLNACYSETQADAIAEHIPCVIGMKKAIGDAAAIEFAVAFYDALGAGKSVEFAHKLACNAIQWAGMPEHLTPVLKGKAQTSQVDVIRGSENQDRRIADPDRSKESRDEREPPDRSHTRRVAMGVVIGGVSSFVAVFIFVFILLIVVSTLSNDTAFQGSDYIIPPLVYGFLGAIAGGVIARLGKRSKSFLRLILIGVIITVPILAALVWMSDRSDRAGIAFLGGVIGIPAVIVIAMLIYVVTVARKWIAEGSGNPFAEKPSNTPT